MLSTLPEASGRADAALQSPDEDLFSGFEDFARSEGDVDGGFGSESRTLSWAIGVSQPLISSEPYSFWYGRRVVGSGFGGRDSSELYRAVPDSSAPAQSLSHDSNTYAALQSPDPQSLFSGFEEFSRPAASDESEAARPSQSPDQQSLFLDFEEFSRPAASDESEAARPSQSPDQPSLFSGFEEFTAASDGSEAAQPSNGEAASACTERDAALAAVARALGAPDIGSTTAEAEEQPPDLPRSGVLPSRKKILRRSSSREREQRGDATETGAVLEAAGSSAVARLPPQEIEMSRCNLGEGVPQSLSLSGVEDYERRVSNDGSPQPVMRRSGSPQGVRFFLRDDLSPRGSEIRSEAARDGRRKSDEVDGSSSNRRGLIRRSMDLLRSRRPEDPNTRGVCVLVCVGVPVLVRVECRQTDVYVRVLAYDAVHASVPTPRARTSKRGGKVGARMGGQEGAMGSESCAHMIRHFCPLLSPLLTCFGLPLPTPSYGLIPSLIGPPVTYIHTYIHPYIPSHPAQLEARWQKSKERVQARRRENKERARSWPAARWTLTERHSSTTKSKTRAW